MLSPVEGGCHGHFVDPLDVYDDSEVCPVQNAIEKYEIFVFSRPSQFVSCPMSGRLLVASCLKSYRSDSGESVPLCDRGNWVSSNHDKETHQKDQTVFYSLI